MATNTACGLTGHLPQLQSGNQHDQTCQSARKKDPLSASKRDPFRCDLCAAMDVSLFG